MQELVPDILQAIFLGGRYLARVPAAFSPLFESVICHYIPTHHAHENHIYFASISSDVSQQVMHAREQHKTESRLQDLSRMLMQAVDLVHS